jgi:hypothetical protein
MKVEAEWSGRHLDPWESREPVDFPSPALNGTLSPSEGERDG